MNIQVVDTLHPLYKNVLARGAALGYTRPSYRGQLLQNEFVKDLVASNTWNSLDGLWIIAMKSGSREFAMIDFKNPTGTLSTLEASGSLTFTDELGINGSGSAGYVDTKFSPLTHGVNFTQNLNSVLIAVTNNRSASSGIVDMGNPNTRIRCLTGALAGFFSVNGTEIASPMPDNSTLGLYHLQRANSTTIRLRKNGTIIRIGLRIIPRHYPQARFFIVRKIIRALEILQRLA